MSPYTGGQLYGAQWCPTCGQPKDPFGNHSCTVPRTVPRETWAGDPDFLRQALEQGKWWEGGQKAPPPWEQRTPEETERQLQKAIAEMGARLKQKEIEGKFLEGVEMEWDEQNRTLRPVEPPPEPPPPIKAISTDWLLAAALRCKESDSFLRLEIEDRGVTVIGEAGERYEVMLIPWTVMENAEINPLIPAIEHVERELEKAK